MPETKGFKDGNTVYTYVDETARNLANPPEGNPGDVLTRTETGTEWAAPGEGLPEGGTVGQVVTKTADGAEWADPQGGGDDNAFEVVFNASLTAITSAGVGEPVTATANHTAAEVDAAFAAGKNITAKIIKNQLDLHTLLPLAAEDLHQAIKNLAAGDDVILHEDELFRLLHGIEHMLQIGLARLEILPIGIAIDSKTAGSGVKC